MVLIALDDCWDATPDLKLWLLRRDFLLKTQDIDNIAKRLESYPPPADGLPVTHPAALGGPQVPTGHPMLLSADTTPLISQRQCNWNTHINGEPSTC